MEMPRSRWQVDRLMRICQDEPSPLDADGEAGWDRSHAGGPTEDFVIRPGG